jgi:hypothetical protein
MNRSTACHPRGSSGRLGVPKRLKMCQRASARRGTWCAGSQQLAVGSERAAFDRGRGDRRAVSGLSAQQDRSPSHPAPFCLPESHHPLRSRWVHRQRDCNKHTKVFTYSQFRKHKIVILTPEPAPCSGPVRSASGTGSARDTPAISMVRDQPTGCARSRRLTRTGLLLFC